MKSSEKRWEVKQVIADLSPSKSSVEVFAARIQPNIASSLIRKLNLCAPLPFLSHVKRIQRKVKEDGVELSIILCSAPQGSDKWSSNKAPLEVSPIVEEHDLIPFVATVPQHEAFSREEWEDQCCLWPTSYHPNAMKPNQAVSFEKSELEDICKHMRLAILQAQLAAKSGQPPNGAVIVDPATGVIRSFAHDETGGWMSAPCLPDHEQEPLGDSISIHANAENPSTNKKLHSWHPLRHAVMVAIEREAERNKAENDDYEESHTDSRKAITKWPRTNNSTDIMEKRSRVGGDQYLWTGFDAYITREPCSMCAMALLHQRVRRVFYGISNSKLGALGGFHRLHGMRGLNHHYLVFKVILSEEDLLE